ELEGPPVAEGHGQDPDVVVVDVGVTEVGRLGARGDGEIPLGELRSLRHGGAGEDVALQVEDPARRVAGPEGIGPGAPRWPGTARAGLGTRSLLEGAVDPVPQDVTGGHR